MNSCRLSSDYNVFGYDPEGFLAHLAALFYGPEWRPRISGPRPYYTGVIQPPRYGPPAFHQRACLPEDFVVCLPPHYFGIPSPPYLSAPQNFHPDFASVLKGLQISILQDQMKTYSVKVTYICGLAKKSFDILTDITWPEFHSKICNRLQTNPAHAQLEYRIVNSGMYSTYARLDMELEWSLAMMSICRGHQEDCEVEIEILELEKPGRYASTTCLNHGLALSLNAPRIKTYAFTYPTISDLFDNLNTRDCLMKVYRDMEDFWSSDILDILERVPMGFVDELTLISPRVLHLATGMPAWRIDSMYEEGMEMIKCFHKEMEIEIDAIEKRGDLEF